MLRWRGLGVLMLVSLAVLSIGRVVAQSEPAAPREPPDRPAGQVEEITVVGQRILRELRLEVQAARERVYDLFNLLNSNDEFDIHCRNAPRTGSRIPQRVCRPRFADNATSDAARDFLGTLLFECDIVLRTGEWEECMLRTAIPRAQEAVAAVPVKDQELVAEVRRLTRENREFRRSITDYQAVERRYQEARLGEGPALWASASILDPVGAAAVPSRRTPLQDGTVAPRPGDLVTPDVSWGGRAGGALREGWVKLRYSVLADGATADVRVADATPPGLDPLSAMTAVQSWTFEPATAADVPIDWHNNLAVIVFSREPAVPGSSLEFAEAYEDVAGLISSGRYEEAKSRNERMQREVAVSLEEMGLAQMQLAAIEHALGDTHAALHAIRRATGPGVPQLEDEELILALEHRFTLELELGLAVDAVETYERRAALSQLRSRDPLARQGTALRQALEAPETGVAIQGRIDADGQWEHALTWNTFAVGDVDGHNESLEVECNRNKAMLPFEGEVELTIPASWGECAVFVNGPPGTTFTLYEFSEPVP